MKLPGGQRQLVDRLKAGWTVVIYHDDDRTRYYAPKVAGCLIRDSVRGHRSTVNALLNKGIIEPVGNKIGDGSVTYKLS